MDSGDWVATGVAGLGLGVAIWSAVYSRRATVASERSAAASERSAAAAEALVPAPPPPVRWRLDRGRGDMYLLRNLGRSDATDVRISELPAGAGILKAGPQPLTVPAGEATEVHVIGTGQTGRATSLRVECAELSEPSVIAVTR